MNTVFSNPRLACFLGGMLFLWIEGTTAGTIAQSPLYLGISAPPLVMLTMERDHKLYYEAYNDASDVNGDGVLDTRYNPDLRDPTDASKAVDYYGYFDSHKCYSYGSGKFTPTSTTSTKKCSGAWSGDFLNYLTTSRMDALRRVLYGGWRSTDTNSSTILERSYIPQDAHSWGKEYTSTAIDGYDIHDYTPLTQPSVGTRHLFANTTLLCPSGNSDPGCGSNTGLPLLRILDNSSYRVWEWLSIERPVAGLECATGNNSRSNCAHAATNYNSYPSDAGAFAALINTFGNASHRYGSGSPGNGRIDGSGNPYGSSDYYLNIFKGTLTVSNSGTYQFAVDGDDAVEVLIDGVVVAGWYGGHGKCSCQDNKGSVVLSVGTHTVEFHHQERDGGDSYYLYWKGLDTSGNWQIVPAGKFSGLTQTTYNVTYAASAMTDYVVRVQACVSGLLESECRGYPNDSPAIFKPTGLLHEYGSNDQMAFGLLTGSYAKNTSGGVLRKNVSTFTDEVDSNTGIFTNANGIVSTINKLKTVGFGNSYSYDQSCAVPEVGGPLTEGRCRMWGNPMAEMMFEGLRYFSGMTSPTSAYSISTTGIDDSNLSLPLPSWVNPYGAKSTSPAGGGYPQCSKPSELVISDINPNHDTDQLPGQHIYSVPSSTPSFSGDTSLNGNTINVETLANTIWNTEYGGSKNLFIGQSGNNYDGAPTPKSSSSFGSIRGLSPEEPTKQGGFYEGSVALFGKTNDINSVAGIQKMDTLSVALASPLPRIVFPVAGKTLTLVPFAKTVGGCGGVLASKGSFQPTNTIVDFYVDTIKNTDSSNSDSTVNGGLAYAKFRINFEDSEYGSDHDMDAITEYELTARSAGTVDVKLTSSYAAGGCIQHMGYVMSGSTADGVYLEVRDPDTTAVSDVDYYLDTPDTSGVALPTTATRNFTPGTLGTASFVAHDPLWYAAKWGGFLDKKTVNGVTQSLPAPGEWDIDKNGVPDSYFLVTNAGKLKQQLTSAFNEITKKQSSSSSVATNSTSAGSDTLIYQARFNSGDWSGQVLAYHFGINGQIGALEWSTDTAGNIPPENERKIFSYDPSLSGVSKGIEFCWSAGCSGSGGSTKLSDKQKEALDLSSFNSGLVKSPIVSYLRGDQTMEQHSGNGGVFRDRIGTDPVTKATFPRLLGDIVNSDPVYIGASSFGYESLPSTASERSSYLNFRATSESRRKMLYVGANDGMLHGFDALTGAEKLAYVPNAVITADLKTLTSQGYVHRYFVDGAPSVSDAYFANEASWKTVLVSTLGAGGHGVFALDVSNPDSFGASNVLWEFTGSDDNDLGVTIPQAAIGRMADGHWGAIISNGPNSSNGKAVLFILDVETGDKLAEITAEAAGNNGLFAPVAVDVDNPPDRIIDYIYAGDLKGNLWKFDVTGSSPGTWAVAYGGALFTTSDGGSPETVQPITTKPVVGKTTSTDQKAGVMVYFGTGKYFEEVDNQTPTPPVRPQVNSFYGIWDQCDKTNAASCNGRLTGRGLLQGQSISFEGIACLADPITGACSGANTEAPIRITSANAVDYKDPGLAQKGWYLDLSIPASAPLERVVTPAVLRGSRVIFATLLPSADPCNFGGNSWLMELDAGGGYDPASPVIDINNDDKVNIQDRVIPNNFGAPVVPAGYQPPKLGIFKTPTILDCGTLECKILSGSSGDLGVVKEGGSGGGGGGKGKRTTWRQLR